MPQFARSTAASNSSFDALDRVSNTFGSHAFTDNTTGAATSTTSSRRSSWQNKRSSLTALPDADIYSRVIRENEPRNEFGQKHLGDRNSMMANYNNASKQRTQYYEEQFQYKDNVNSSVRERVQRESPVIAELRTNVIIKDEFTLVTDLSYHLAARYTRPDSAIMVKVDHSACLALGGTFDPCYILTITTVPSQMGPTMNKRNAALIQSFMADILSVPPERGILKFTPIPEENFAINGTTMLGEIERQEKAQSNESGNPVRRVLSNGRKSIPSFKKSSTRLDTTEETLKEGRASRRQSVDSKSTLDVHDRKNSIPTPSAAILSTNSVFELPATETDKQRPSTAHSHTASRASSGSDGLRMNGISDAKLNDSKGPDGRPRTFSGATTSIQDKIQAQALSDPAPAPPPVRQSAAPQQKRERPPSFLKLDPTKILPGKSSRPTTPNRGSTAPPQDENKPRPRDSYIDGLMGKPVDPAGSKEPTIVEEGPQGKEKDEPTANQAKRRSTVGTALPKMMEPPPVPETSNDTKSTKSLKVGKRKSFLAAFRKSTAAA